MKNLIGLIVLSVATSAWADPNCGVLKNVVGLYEQVSNTCTVEKDMGFSIYKFIEVTTKDRFFPDRTHDYFQAWINHMATADNGGGVGFGPSTQANDIYKCAASKDILTVTDPQFNAEWSFTSTNATFFASGCIATFKKVK